MADLNFDIWRMQAQSDVHGLIALLHHPSPEIRRRVATALRALGATAAIPALQSALVNEADVSVRHILVSALDDLFKQTPDGENKEARDHQHKVVYWISQLSSTNEEHIIRAAQNLADLGEKIAAEALVIVFRNPKHSARIRLAAAEALIKLESAPIEATLLAALRNPDWHTRRNAAGVLGQLHADWAVEALSAALRDPNEVVRRTAYAALKRIDTPEAQRATETPVTLENKTATSEHTVVSFFETVAKISQTQEVPKLPVPERTKTAELPTATPSETVPMPPAQPDLPKDVPAPQAIVETNPPEVELAKSAEQIATVDVPPPVEPTLPSVPSSEATLPLPAQFDLPKDVPAPQVDTKLPDPEPMKAVDVIVTAPTAPELNAMPQPAQGTVGDEDTQPIEPVRDEDVC